LNEFLLPLLLSFYYCGNNDLIAGQKYPSLLLYLIAPGIGAHNKSAESVIYLYFRCVLIAVPSHSSSESQAWGIVIIILTNWRREAESRLKLRP